MEWKRPDKSPMATEQGELRKRVFFMRPSLLKIMAEEEGEQALIEGPELSVGDTGEPCCYDFLPRNKKHYCDLDPQLPDEIKDFYARHIVNFNEIEDSRPSVMASRMSKMAFNKSPMVWKFWMFRRLVVERLQFDVDEELLDLEMAMKKDPKNCYMWEHRRWIALKLGTNDARKELEFTKNIIDIDANNFLAWSHRQWVLQAFDGDWEDELTYCDKVLREDVSNRFAWDQRFFAVVTSPTLGGMEVMRDKEVEYAVEAIVAKPWNECPWTYIKRLYADDDSRSLVNNPRVEAACLSILRKEIHNAKLCCGGKLNVGACVNALNMIGDLVKFGLKPSDKWGAVIEALRESDGSTLQLAKFDVDKFAYQERFKRKC